MPDFLEDLIEAPKPKIPNPTFEMPREVLGDIEEGQKFNGILNYEVIEKTKSFAILRIEGLTMKPIARKF